MREGMDRMRVVAMSVALGMALVLVGCAPATVDAGGATSPASPSAEPTPEEGRGDPIPDEPVLSPPTSETTTMTDPVAGSFTVEVPLGWDTTAYSTGMYSDHREAVVSISPDGNTIVFLGDPKLPAYWSPSASANQTDAVRGWVERSDLAEWVEYTPATQWVQEWTATRFGGLDGFVLEGTMDDPVRAQEVLDLLTASLGDGGFSVTAATATFQYETAVGTMRGMVEAVTFGNAQAWNAVVQGLSTAGDPQDYHGMLRAMAASKQLTPDWQQRQNQFWVDMEAQSQAFTQQLIANHNANMDWIRTSAAAHQQRMQSIWAANDASMTSYYQRMDSMDAGQRSFLNYIQDEHTVQGSSGQTWQVPQGSTVYYVNPSSGQTVGGNANFSEQDLVSMGLNPSDWTLTEIVR